MWRDLSFGLPAAAFDHSFNSSLVAALAGSTLPVALAEANELAADAEQDAQRRDALSAYAQQLHCLSFDPWQHGNGGNKRSLARQLSPTTALEQLQSALEHQDWQACLVLVITGAQLDDWVLTLQQAETALALPEIQRCKRHAMALATHDTDKLFIAAASPMATQTQANQWPALGDLTAVQQNLAYSEALATDTNPVAQLADFNARRQQRLADLRQQLNEAQTANNATVQVLHLQGDFLAAQLADNPVPDSNAPWTLMVALGGTTDAVQPIHEALS